MGSSASKASRSAGKAARVYPKQASQAATRSPKPSPAAASRASQPGPTVHPAPEASEAKDDAITSDAQDPALAAKLRSIGAVQPNPYYSHRSTSPFDPRRPSESNMPDFSAGPNPFAPPPPGGAAAATAARPNRPGSMPNPALSILSARDRLQREAEADLENAAKPSAPGRRFLDPTLIRRVLVMRDREGKTDDAIEEEMGLERGFVKRLGPRRVVEAV
ncbi:uncharacterized protein J3D65DRAFT_610567 [Phyllosticta citribraziliensis]|uniref:Helix-turn-helix domain-containing protein n=1 Tax=Phyllosticta citribraziliensis TaxID=989973 RepID=A0ABR1MD41_9PEZI